MYLPHRLCCKRLTVDVISDDDNLVRVITSLNDDDDDQVKDGVKVETLVTSPSDVNKLSAVSNDADGTASCIDTSVTSCQ